MTNNFRVQSFSSCHDAAPSCSTTCGKKIIWLTKSPCFWSCMTPISSEKHLVFYYIFFPIFYKFFWIFQIQNEKYRNIPKFLFSVTSRNEKFSEISSKLLTLARREADENLRQCGPTRPNVRERTKNRPYKIRTYIQPSWTDLMTSKIFQSVNMHIL